MNCVSTLLLFMRICIETTINYLVLYIFDAFRSNLDSLLLSFKSNFSFCFEHLFKGKTMGCTASKKRLRGASFPIFPCSMVARFVTLLNDSFEVHSLRAQNITHCKTNVHTKTFISSNQFHIISHLHVRTRALFQNYTPIKIKFRYS